MIDLHKCLDGDVRCVHQHHCIVQFFIALSASIVSLLIFVEHCLLLFYHIFQVIHIKNIFLSVSFSNSSKNLFSSCPPSLNSSCKSLLSISSLVYSSEDYSKLDPNEEALQFVPMAPPVIEAAIFMRLVLQLRPVTSSLQLVSSFGPVTHSTEFITSLSV